MEKITDEQLKKEMFFDQYGRYATIRNIINANRENGVVFKVLDVGGEMNIMKKFLPDDDVYYLDPNVDSDDKNFIKADGCDMPFEDVDFDWVVSAYVFEHIPKEKRKYPSGEVGCCFGSAFRFQRDKAGGNQRQ